MKRYYDPRNKRLKSQSITFAQAAGIVLFVFSVVVFLCLISGGAVFGNIGREINSFVIACLGFFSFAAFAALIYASVAMLAGLRASLPAGRALSAAGLLLASLLTLQLITSAQMLEQSQNFSQYVSACYGAGLGGISSSTAGGALFAAAVYPLYSWLGTVGSYIVLGGAILLFAFFAAGARNFLSVGGSGDFAPRRAPNDLPYRDYDIGGAPLPAGQPSAAAGPKPKREKPREEDSGPLRQVSAGLFVTDFGSTVTARQKKSAAHAEDYDILLSRTAEAGAPEDFPSLVQPDDDRRKKSKSLLFNAGADGSESGGLAPGGYQSSYAADEEERRKKLEYIRTPLKVLPDMTEGSDERPASPEVKTHAQTILPKHVQHTGSFTPGLSQQGDSIGKSRRKKILDNQMGWLDLADNARSRADEPDEPPADTYPTEAEEKRKKYMDYLPGQPDGARPIINAETYSPEKSGGARKDFGQNSRPENWEMGIGDAPAAQDLFGSQQPDRFDGGFLPERHADGARPPQGYIQDNPPPRPAIIDAEDWQDGVNANGALPWEDDPGQADGDDFMPPVPRPWADGAQKANQDSPDAKEETPSEKGKEAFQPQKPDFHRYSPYNAPPISLLTDIFFDPNELTEDLDANAAILEQTLEDFKISAKVVNITQGPSVTRYELSMPAGIPVNRVTSRSDDIAMRLASKGDVRIEAPIPGKPLLGIEIPNSKKAKVGLRDVLASDEFFSHKSKLAFALGKDIAGKNIIADISKMPHLLIAGSTGSGKSVCLNCIIMSLLYKTSPEDVRIILIDPKRVEFNMYDNLPHLMLKNVITDSEKAISAFGWAIGEMNRRFELFKEKGAKDIQSYNDRIDPDTEQKLFRIVIIVDELAELMSGKRRDEMEDRIKRLSQLSRAAGIHLVLATQRPSVDIITGVIKSNLPSRVSFRVISQVDSRTVLDMSGAEKLLGDGDMMYMTGNMSKPMRLQGPFVSINEVEAVVSYVRENNEAYYDDDIAEKILVEHKKEEEVVPISGAEESENSKILPRVLRLGIESGQISISMVQRKFGMGYARAGKLVDELENRGYVSSFDGSKPRQVLMSMEEFVQTFGELE